MKSSRPQKFYIVEVVKWVIDDYKKVYFVEQEYKSYFYLYNYCFNEKNEKTKTDYEDSDFCLNTEEEAMKQIIEIVKMYITKDKKESDIEVKSVKTLKEITFDEVVALIEKSNAD